MAEYTMNDFKNIGNKLSYNTIDHSKNPTFLNSSLEAKNQAQNDLNNTNSNQGNPKDKLSSFTKNSTKSNSNGILPHVDANNFKTNSNSNLPNITPKLKISNKNISRETLMQEAAKTGLSSYVNSSENLKQNLKENKKSSLKESNASYQEIVQNPGANKTSEDSRNKVSLIDLDNSKHQFNSMSFKQMKIVSKKLQNNSNSNSQQIDNNLKKEVIGKIRKEFSKFKKTEIKNELNRLYKSNEYDPEFQFKQTEIKFIPRKDSKAKTKVILSSPKSPSKKYYYLISSNKNMIIEYQVVQSQISKPVQKYYIV